MRKSDIRLNIHEDDPNLNKDLSFKNFDERKRSANANANANAKNYYTPENIDSKQAKTNNYMIKLNDDSSVR
jgi:hypothetical protein